MGNIFRFHSKGIYHSKNHTECQDRLMCKCTDDKAFMAISDGCSSSRFGGKAAESNVECISRLFSILDINDLNSKNLSALYPNDKERLERSCEKPELLLEVPLKRSLTELNCKDDSPFRASDYCATLLFAVKEKEQTLIGHIGDGYILCFDKNDDLIFISEPENGESSSHTFFTVNGSYEEHFRTAVIPSDNIASIVMFSDGPQSFFKTHGNGDVVEGVRNCIMAGIKDGTVNSNEDLKDRLVKYFIKTDYSHFSDDWSITVYTESADDSNMPYSLEKLYDTEYKKLNFDSNGNVINNGTEKADATAENVCCDNNSEDDVTTAKAITECGNPLNANKEKTKDDFAVRRFFFFVSGFCKDFNEGMKEYL